MSIAGTLVPLSSPYKGLAAFDDSDIDALLFFGRARETEIVVANVLASRLTVLYGPSGVGKSSLLRAGVARALRKTEFPSPAVAVYGTWAGEPLAGLEEASRAAVAEALGREPADAPGGLTDKFAAWSAELGAELCLLVDQLEELFLYHPAEEGAAGFVDLLPELILRPGLRVNVLLGIRDDALAQLDVFKSRIPGLFANSLRLDHLDREAGRAAILGPLERYATIAGPDEQMEIEPELVDVVLDEVAAGRIEPSLAGRGAVEGAEQAGQIETPYLQLVLQRMWEVERERGSRVLRLETFRGLGGAEHIVQDHLERALRALTPAEQDAAANVFDHLVTPSGKKIAHGVADLATYASVGEQELEPVLDSLARQRILRPLGENGHAGGRYEIFHDVLAGAVLAWRTRHEADAAIAHEREGARRRHRVLGWLVMASLAALAAMTGLALYAFSQRSEARQQAAEASVQRSNAVGLAAQSKDAANKALAARRRAQEKTYIANVQKKKADAARADANQKTQDALDAKADLKRQASIALASEADANLAKADAQQKQAVAQKATLKARALRRQATNALRREERAKTRANARLFIARAVGLVSSDPQLSARSAVRATDFIVDAGDRRDAENALRAALVAMRVQHILPGTGTDGARVARFSGDGRRVVVGVGRSSEGLRIFRSRDGRLLQTFRATTVLNDAALSRDGRFVAAGARDGRVWIWDVNTGALRHFDHDAPVSGVVWSPAGDKLVSVGLGPSPSARIWDPSTGARLNVLSHPLPLDAAIFSPDGRRLATYGEGRWVHVFDFETGVQLPTLEHPSGAVPVATAAFAPGGDLIATGRGNVARLWNVETGESVMTLGTHTRTVADIAFSPDGERVATGSFDTLARVFKVASGAPDDVIHGHSGLGVNDVDFSPDSTAVVTAGADKTIRYSAPGQLSVLLLGHDDAVLGASFSPDGRSILSASKDGSARLWDPYGEPVPSPLGDYGRSLKVTTVAVDPTGSRIAVGRDDGLVQILSPDGRVVRAPVSRGPRVVSVAWARGQTLLAATVDGHVQIWGAAGVRRLDEFDHGSTIAAAAISRDGKLVATAGSGRDRTVRLWRMASGTYRTLQHDQAVSSVALDPTGRFVASASGDSAYVWPTSGGKPLELKPEGDTANVTGVTFGANGRLLATSNGDGQARLWNARSGKLVKTLIRHGGTVSSVAFSADGRWLATGGLRKAGVWQVRDSDLEGSFLFFVAPLRDQQGQLLSVAFSPRSWTIVMGTANGHVYTYKCVLCGGLSNLLPKAKAKLAHLEAEERR